MAEEHRVQPPRLCFNNCGFFGSPVTQNLCSKCFRDLQLQHQHCSSSTNHALNQTLAAATAVSQGPTAFSPISQSPKLEEGAVLTVDLPETLQVPNRCSTCRLRVGLTGFKCRCGFVYCVVHRYPEQHECSFDFKELGKGQIAKANPVVKADKMEKI